MNSGCGRPSSSSCVTSGIRRAVNVENPVITQYSYMIKYDQMYEHSKALEITESLYHCGNILHTGTMET